VFLKDGRAFVFDAGPTKLNKLHRFFENHPPKIIECVVLSHNDRDHTAGWEEFAKRFGDRIRDVWVLQDRELGAGSILDLTMWLHEEGVIPCPHRAEVRDLKRPETIWQDDQLGLRLELLYPDFYTNTQAIRSRQPNRTCAIACFHCCDETILYPGDSPLDAWRDLHAAQGGEGVKLAILALPHHGGLLGRATGPEDLRWLFQDVLNCDVAIISVGTTNPHGHPRAEVVEALREAGVRVMCTELTPRCHGGGSLRDLGHSVLDAGIASIGEWVQGSGSVSCAGTVVAVIRTDGLRINRMEEHKKAVTSSLLSPMCCVAGG
jgi:beta-lactamase superfamily II metal-dependent hydrolase